MAKTRQGPKAVCECCNLIYRKDLRNAHNQRFCTRADCVWQRKRQRQNTSYKNKYRTDKQFQQAERTRCGKGLKARRQAERQRAAADPPPPPWNLEMVVLGMVSGLTDAEDPTATEASLRRLERTGQRMTATTPLGRGVARVPAEPTVPRHPFEAKRTVPRHSFRG